jgi:nucleotide-binding universal stress UspA family protein
MLPRDLGDGDRTPEHTYPVIVGVDGSFAAIHAARWAAAIAERFEAPLEIVHAVADRPAADSAVRRQSAEAILQSAKQAVRVHFKGLPIAVIRVDGSPGQALIESSHAARLIVFGTDEASSGTVALGGSTTEAVAAYSVCPVVAWRGDVISPTRQPIAVGVDHDQGSRVAITAAFEFADHLGVGILAVHAWTTSRPLGDVTLRSRILWAQVESDAQQHLSESLLPWIDLYPNVDVAEIVEPDKPDRALLRSAQGAQIQVVGSRASGLVARLGSIGLELLHHATIPVMFCHSSDEQG